MGIVDAFAAEEKINMRFSEFHALVNAAVKSEFLVNAVNANVPHRYIRGMLTGREEVPPVPMMAEPIKTDDKEEGAKA